MLPSKDTDPAMAKTMTMTKAMAKTMAKTMAMTKAMAKTMAMAEEYTGTVTLKDPNSLACLLCGDELMCKQADSSIYKVSSSILYRIKSNSMTVF